MESFDLVCLWEPPLELNPNSRCFQNFQNDSKCIQNDSKCMQNFQNVQKLFSRFEELPLDVTKQLRARRILEGSKIRREASKNL